MIRRCLLHLAMAVAPCVALLAAPSASQAGLFGPRPVVAYYPAYYPGYTVGYAGTYNVGYSPYAYTTSYAPYTVRDTPYAVGYLGYTAGYAPYTTYYTSTAYYAPYTSYYAPAVTSYYAPAVAAPACSTCSSCQSCNYAPQTCYRTVYNNVPVTTYRPIVSTDPCTGCSTTTMQAVTSYSLQPQVVAYTAAYAPCAGTCNTCAAAPACSSCAGTTTNYAPAPAPACSSCGGATVGSTTSTTTTGSLATNPAPVMNNTAPNMPATPNAPSSISTPSANRTFLEPSKDVKKDENSLQKFPEESTSHTRPTSIFEKPDRTARLATPATGYHQVSLREKAASPAPLDNSHWKAAK